MSAFSADTLIKAALLATFLVSCSAVGSCLAAWATYFEQRRKLLPATTMICETPSFSLSSENVWMGFLLSSSL